MRFGLIFFLLSLPCLAASAQQVLKSADFIVATPFLEPEEVSLSIKDGREGIVNFGKKKGTTTGSSVYLLEYRLPNLEVKWDVSINFDQFENILHMRIHEREVTLFSVLHNEKSKTSQLKITSFNLENGTLKGEKILWERSVGSWRDSYGKGAIRNTLENTLLSGSKSGYVTPLEYRFYITSSPDDSKILIYHYDFSKDNLMTISKIFDPTLKTVSEATLPIDNGYLNTNLQINNKGNVALLNSKEDGTIAVVHFNLKGKSSQFLSMPPSNLKRNSFTLEFEDDEIVNVFNLTTRNNRLSGLMVSRFNFREERVDSVYYYDFARSNNVSKDTAFNSLNFKAGNYELAYVKSTSGGKIFFIEQRDYVSAGQSFDFTKGDVPNNWKARKGRLLAGDVVVVHLNHEYQLNWRQIITKDQSSISDEGFITSGFDSEIFDGKIHILYAIGSGSASVLNLVSLEISNGKIKEVSLPNPHNLILLRPYTQWVDENTLILAGKRGFGGKSSMILKYKLE